VRTFIRLSVAGALIAGVGGVFAVSAGAQTGAPAGNLAKFCAARVALDPALSQGKAATRAVFDRIVANAPAPIVEPVTKIRAQFTKNGEKAFDKLSEEIAAADEFTYTNCPGAKVDVAAIDYAYQGMPAILKPGVTQFKLTNNSTKEAHEMGLGKLLPANESMSVEKMLALPEKKADKLFDPDTGGGMYAPVGESGYMVIDLKPGKYVYACFIPVGEKTGGKPHALEGMYGSFTVQ
jgi:uncharacterized cupredoxin-like copper-binding protein